MTAAEIVRVALRAESDDEEVCARRSDASLEAALVFACLGPMPVS